MSSPRFSRILLTGAAGRLGGMLRAQLRHDCQTLRISDISDLHQAHANEEVVIADLADRAAVLHMVESVDAIVHMGGVAVEGPFQPILEANIVGLFNLYEAARKCGHPRVVFASSNHVTGFYPQGETINPDYPKRPDGLYGVSKSFGEDLARFYYDRYGIKTACLRIGSAAPTPLNKRALSTWLSDNDLTALVRACLYAPNLGYEIIYGVSNNSRGWWDNTKVSSVNYVAGDSADAYAAEIEANAPAADPNNPVEQFQGGAFVVAGPFDD